MRCFVAIDIDDGLRAALGDLQQRLADAVDIKKSDVKWVRPETIHLTLKFLGEIKDSDVVEICNVVKEVADRHENFELEMKSVGFFGTRSARVLWVGTAAGADKLRALAAELEARLAAAGWPPDSRQFKGHLTLCRIRSSKAGIKLARKSEQYRDFKLGSISADSISVYQSRLTPTGPVYTLLGNYKMK
jgi:2'-5' RNA ligase